MSRPTDQPNTDPIIAQLLALHEHHGPVILALFLAIVFGGVLVVLALIESRTGRIRRMQIPLWTNFSTLIDFALLNPILIVLIARSTQRILALPATLTVSLPLSAPELLKLNGSFGHDLFLWRQFSFWAALLSLAAWSIYALYTHTSRRPQHVLGSLTLTASWIGIVTGLLMYLLLMFSVLTWTTARHIAALTRDGFRLDVEHWTHGCEVVGGVVGSMIVVWFIFVVIVALFFLQDVVVFHRRFRIGRLRVAASVLFLLYALGAPCSIFFTVHDNAVATKNAAMLSAFEHMLEPWAQPTGIERIRMLRSLSEWPIVSLYLVLPLLIQIGYIVLPVIREATQSVFKRRHSGPVLQR